MADLANRRPLEKDTIFAIASMTKPITATAVMILRDGRLSSKTRGGLSSRVQEARLAESRRAADHDAT